MNKIDIINIALNNAAFDGWNNKMLKNSGLELEFIYGINEFTEFFHQYNQDMLLNMASPEGKIREKIAFLVESRLFLHPDHQLALKQLMAFYILPGNQAIAAKHLWDVADKIWYMVGDNSTDYNYYTKRALLSAVYSSSLLYFITDESENFQATRSFIKRRIENVMQIGNLKGIIKKFPFIRLI